MDLRTALQPFYLTKEPNRDLAVASQNQTKELLSDHLDSIYIKFLSLTVFIRSETFKPLNSRK